MIPMYVVLMAFLVNGDLNSLYFFLRTELNNKNMI